jgi:AcrR family transcriptional regulator
MPPRPDVSDRRRKEIREAAALLFSQEGFERARMDDIASKAGISKPTIYLYYKNKEALLEAILEDIFEGAYVVMEHILSDQRSAADRIVVILEATIDTLENAAWGYALMLELYALASRKEEMRACLERIFARGVTLLAALLQQGIERGEFRPIDPQETAIAMTGLVEGICLMQILCPGASDSHSVYRNVLALLLAGMKA